MSESHVTFEPPPRPELRIIDTLRGTLAGNAAVKVAASALTLFEAGGKKLLGASARAALRTAAERGTARALSIATTPVLEAASAIPSLGRPAADAAAKGLESLGAAESISVGVAAGGITKQMARTAAKQVLRGAGRAAAIGFVVDGAVAGVEAVIAVRNGSADRATAMQHVAREAASGAVATGAGVLVGAGLVALTGGLAAPVVFAASAAGSIGVKRVVRKWMG